MMGYELKPLLNYLYQLVRIFGLKNRLFVRINSYEDKWCYPSTRLIYFINYDIIQKSTKFYDDRIMTHSNIPFTVPKKGQKEAKKWL